MSFNIYNNLLDAKEKGVKKFVVLIDPDKLRLGNVENVIEKSLEAGVDYFFVGGSLIINDMMDYCLDTVKKLSSIPTILFPGNTFQINQKADALLFLSLISGRNPELLIGKHVIAAPILKNSNLEIISTGYMLIDGGAATSVSYMSNTMAIPSNKDDIALCTALAGELLGLKVIYMDAGSGALKPVSASMINAVSESVRLPLIVGGGIKNPEKVYQNVQAGADVIVVGNAIEKDPNLLKEMVEALKN